MSSTTEKMTKAITENIRNFCIIAHIDHGKSTLADRLLELTHTVEKRKMKEQVLDQMDIERERGITIKMAPVRMEYQGYILNLIDTPGHVDFQYEVSRSLAAVEGALLVVDATQGIQAQTIANLHQALEQDLTIIPVINKIDMPAADVARVAKEIENLLGSKPNEIIKISAKTGENVEQVLQEVIDKIPTPTGSVAGDLQILIFDSMYDTYQGVLTHVRVSNGAVKRGDQIYLVGSGQSAEVLEVGIFTPERVKQDTLRAGEIGYLATTVKDLQAVRVGDTIVSSKFKEDNAKLKELKLTGYKEVKPMVFAGLYPKKTEEHKELREAIEKINLNDASFVFESERSDALGPGFRAGFLGLLHLDIIRERIKREYDLDIVVTTPSVEYRVKLKGTQTNRSGHRRADAPGASHHLNDTKVVSMMHGSAADPRFDFVSIKRPQELPDPSTVELIEEPWVALEIVTPADYIGSLMNLVTKRRGEYLATEYLDPTRAVLHYNIPLSSILTDFYDKLKASSQGYASMAWEFRAWRESKIVKLDILIAEKKEEALAQLVYEPDAQRQGRQIVERLKELLPRQMFVVKLQAAIGGSIIAAARLSALRKDVTAKLYGGDVTRKRKLLEKQKKGKKRMLAAGKLDVPSNVYLDILKRG